MNHPQTVLRNFSLPVALFDYFKNFQRNYETRNNVRLTNSQVLAIMLRQHQQFTAEAAT